MKNTPFPSLCKMVLPLVVLPLFVTLPSGFVSAEGAKLRVPAGTSLQCQASFDSTRVRPSFDDPKTMPSVLNPAKTSSGVLAATQRGAPLVLEAQLPFFKEIGVKHSVVKRPVIFAEGESILAADGKTLERPVASGMNEFNSYTLDVQLGHLSEVQFQKIKSRYNPNSQIKWERGRSYELIDFLPPFAQASMNHHFLVHREDANPEQFKWLATMGPPHTIYNFSAVSSCWNAVWEFVRRSVSDSHFFFVDEPAIKSIFQDSRLSNKVTELRRPQIENLLTDKTDVEVNKIEPGDVIMLYQKLMIGGQIEDTLTHVAVALDRNLVFELGSSLSASVVRTALTKDALLSFIENRAEPQPELENMRIEVRRFAQPLTPVADYLSLAVRPGVFIDPATLPEIERPPLAWQRNFIVAMERGMSGGLLSESLYRISNFPLQYDTKTQRYIFAP